MEIHILNGDALKAQLPDSLPGERIVMRECLVDGEPSGETLDLLLENRATFLEKAYGASPEEYRRKTVSEIERIRNLPAAAQINLWFEDDLFCQVNLWFSAYLLKNYTAIETVSLVRPSGDLQYGFGGMDKADLILAYRQRQEINSRELDQLSALWRHYQQQEHSEMAAIAESLSDKFSFLPAAVAADLDRYPSDESMGRPQKVLKSLMEELGSEQFGPVFQAFSARESIYGYGDLQVKRLFDELKANA